MKRLLFACLMMTGISASAQLEYDIKAGVSDRGEVNLGTELTFHKENPRYYLAVTGNFYRNRSYENKLSTATVGPRLYVPWIDNKFLAVHPFVGYLRLTQGWQHKEAQNYWMPELGGKILFRVSKEERVRGFLEFSNSFERQMPRLKLLVGFKTIF